MLIRFNDYPYTELDCVIIVCKNLIFYCIRLLFTKLNEKY